MRISLRSKNTPYLLEPHFVPLKKLVFCPSCWSNQFYHQGDRLQVWKRPKKNHHQIKSLPPNNPPKILSYLSSLHQKSIFVSCRLFLKLTPPTGWVFQTFPRFFLGSPERWDSFQLSGCFPPTAQWSSCLGAVVVMLPHAAHLTTRNHMMEFLRVFWTEGFVVNTFGWTRKWGDSQRLGSEKKEKWPVGTCRKYRHKPIVGWDCVRPLHTLGRVFHCQSTIISFKSHKWTILLQICPVTPFVASLHNFPSTKWQ